MLRHGIPRDVVTALRSVSRSFRGWGGSAKVTTPARRRLGARVRRPHARGAAPPRATRRRTRSSTTASAASVIGGDHLIAHISSNPLISRPLGRQVGRAGRRPAARAADLHALAARDARDGRARDPRRATASRSPTTSKLIDERFALHERRADKIAGLIEEQPALGLRDRAGAVGQRRGHAGLPHALRGARPRRPAARGRARGRARPGPAASCASRRRPSPSRSSSSRRASPTPRGGCCRSSA